MKTKNIPVLNMLSDEELEKIHLGTLEILRETGTRVESKVALDLYEKGGCLVDHTQRLVKFPAYLVEDAIGSVPGEILLAGRNSQHDVYLKANRTAFMNNGAAPQIIDPFTGECRKTTKKDVGDLTLILDALGEVDVVQRPATARDVPPYVGPLHDVEAILSNTSKHFIHGTGSGEFTRYQIEIVESVVGGREKLRERPIFSASPCPTSPLCLTEGCCGQIIEAAGVGIPCVIVPMALAGASGPATLAGTLVVHNAEVLSCIVLAQLVRRGTPMIYGSSTSVMDLKTGAAPVGVPERGLISAAVATLARYYGLCSRVSGGWVDSKLADAQAGHELTIGAILPALAGATLINSFGVMDSGLTADMAQYVIGDAITAAVRTALKGIVVCDDTLALDVIKQVGPSGNFMAADHTLKYMKEMRYSDLFDQKTREQWEDEGAQDLGQKAREKVKSLLKTHHPEPLPKDATHSIRKIIKRAEKDLA